MKALGSNQPFLYVEWTYEDNVYLSWNSNERLPGGKRSSGGERFLISEVNLFTEASPTTEVILLLRKTKKAPVTETVLKTIRSEAAKIGWTIEQAMAEMSARGWQGFKASFIQRETLELKTSEKKNERTLTKDQRQIAALDRAEATIAGVARPSARIGLPKF